MEILVTFIGLLFIFAFFECIPTILVSLEVFKPVSIKKETEPQKQKKLFWKMFWIRIIILFFLNLLTSFSIWWFEIILIFIAIIFVKMKYKNDNNDFIRNQQTVTQPLTNSSIFNGKLNIQQVQGNNIQAEGNIEKDKIVLPTSFDPLYRNTDEKMLEIFIERNLKKANIDINSGLYPPQLIKRKIIMNIICIFLTFILITMIFFHFPILTYLIGIIILGIIYISSRKINFMSYLKKQIKVRPSEKVSNIIMNTKNSLIQDNSQKILNIGIVAAIILPSLIFINPRIIYEKMDNGYGVRFYTFGVTNFTSATIPETYKGEKIVSLRGNTFSNMFFLKEINLPDSIIEIRGQAFKNLYFLEEIKLPSKLQYLGGGAFYNCKKLKSILIPDTVTDMGGETFYNATSLESVKLSTNLTEIRGNTFENCTSLKSITIPDKVTRIGGHAFYANSSLSEVVISENSKLVEIGSSAFRLCNNLYSITLPDGVYVNERAFKESPTTINRFSNKEYTEEMDVNEFVEGITGNDSMIIKNQKLLFLDYNISVKLSSYIYDNNGINSGTMIIDFNDGMNNNVEFNFSSTDFQDKENDIISFTYLNYTFRITRFLKNQIGIIVMKNHSFPHLINVASYSFGKEGDAYKLPNSNYEVKLEKKENNNGRYNYYFTCNGEKFDHEIGNGYFNSATYGDDEVKIRINSLYGYTGVYLNIYYN